MSFSIYRTEGDKAYPVESIQFTGPSGLLARHLSNFSDEENPFPWQLNATEIIALANPSLSPDEHVILMDMLPESFVEACFYRLTQLQGSSEYDESDVVMAYKVFYQGPAQSPDFRQCLPIQPQPNHRQMLEALRLTGGTAKGSYRWARPKMDIGAAVCPATSSL